MNTCIEQPPPVRKRWRRRFIICGIVSLLLAPVLISVDGSTIPAPAIFMIGSLFTDESREFFVSFKVSVLPILGSWLLLFVSCSAAAYFNTRDNSA